MTRHGSEDVLRIFIYPPGDIWRENDLALIAPFRDPLPHRRERDGCGTLPAVWRALRLRCPGCAAGRVSPVAVSAACVVVRLLPGVHQERYLEELATELVEIARLPRRAQWRYGFGMLAGAWQLRHALSVARPHVSR